MNSHADALIDQTLQALRDTEVPAGLEARTAARIAARMAARISQASEARTTAAPSFFAVILNAVKDPRILFADPSPSTWATVAFILALGVVFSTIAVRRHEQTIAQGNSTANQPYTHTQTFALPEASPDTNTHIAKNDTRAAKGLSHAFHAPSEAVSAPTPVDPDALALAETNAPSHPAPTMALTSQELLLIRATRRGQPLELAELEPLREPALRAAVKAHERLGLENFVRGLLAPLAAAETLNPTPSSPSPDEDQLPASSDPPSSK